MWKDPDPDPGGTSEKGTSGQSAQELSDLQDQNEQQQLLIAQLKEMLRKEQSNVPQEKIEEYINTLSKVKAKKTRMKREDMGSAERSASSSSIDVNKKGKLNLLRQQLEENKAKLAERGKNQRGIEEMVTQLKAQLNDSQQLISLTPLTSYDSKNLDYNRNSSPEELYNILLTKEKRITELGNRTQKQEATILDLQENLKEKDSVIDARTKAITLMTESLSKKGKSTLDELDDTREQMRKMQEHFVTLETEMKARQVKSLNDLKAKNLEIAELQENNSKLLERLGVFETGDGDKSKDEYQFKVRELEKKLQESAEEIDKLRSNNGELGSLRKQLEESNKNMLKIKVQSKSKLKELTKKLEAIKKTSDANALIVDLQKENTKLSEKIAELEEEKGNMQLKMVESTDSVKEEHKELESKLAKQSEELDEKDKIISLLESDIISLKEEVKNLSSKVSGLSHLENMEVTSEMKSIQIEEQMEKVEGENTKLKEKIEELIREKEELGEKIDELKKEKQELNIKLENYIQENMELIDKLEKLSAEKVSSAESIEIVEGLTQQEKIELAAYQKNLDVHIEGEPIKCPEDDNMESPVELNESVMQLSEDSTELLQRIDMFTIERKEVMGKMEALKEENSRLLLKVKEIENNRDILEETYEQLQNEKEELQNKNDELVKKITKLEDEGVQKGSEATDSGIAMKLQELEDEYDKLLAENDDLKRTLKNFDSKIHEKHNLETDLSMARKKIEELETNINANVEELTFYHTLIEENKSELINSANLINQLQMKLNERESDVKDLNVIINDLNGVVNNLQVENTKLADFGVMETQVGELKSALNEQIQQAQDYEEEIARNNDIIDDLNSKLDEMNKKIIETEHEMEMKDIEMRKLNQDLQNKEETIRNLQKQIEEKDKKINVVVEDMQKKFLSLQKQLDGNSDSLENKVQELTNKNKEQMEKMKKIAANLKKKTQAYQELEARYSGEKEKWETEVNEKESIIENSKHKIDEVLQQLSQVKKEVEIKTQKLTEMEIKERELTEIIQNIEQTNVDLQNSLSELKRREEKLNEISLKQELSTSLHEEFDSSPTNQESANEDKVKELELIIETNQSALTHYTERVHKLEEDVVRLVEEKEAAQRKAVELSDQLNITSMNVEEKALVEEELGQRLAQVTANDEELVRKLEEAAAEIKELTDKNKELEELIYKLKVKIKKAHERVTQLKAGQANMEELEAANAELKKQVATLEASQKHVQDENEELQKRSQNDYERIEADYQTQMEELVGCRHELTVECEKLREIVKEMQAREEELLGSRNELTVECEKLREIIKEMQAREEELLGSRKELTVECEKLREIIKEMQAREEELLGSRNELTVECEKLREIIKEMQVREEKLLTEIDEFKVKMEQKDSENREKIQELLDEARVANFNWNDAQKEIESLNLLVEDLRSQLITKVASETVDSVIAEAQEKVENKTIGCQAVVEIKDIDCQRDRDETSTGSQTVVEVKHVDCQRDRDESSVGCQAVVEIKDAPCQGGAEESSVASQTDHIEHRQDFEVREDVMRAEAIPTFHWPGSQQPSQSQDWFAAAAPVMSQDQSFNLFAAQEQNISNVPPTESLQPFDFFAAQDQSSSNVPPVEPRPQQQFDLFAGQDPSSSNVPHQGFNPFHSQAPPVQENTKEDLLNKIRALEVLLYNVDKEKEEALQECVGMVNELSHLLYAKVAAPKPEGPSTEVEGQIMSEKDVTDAACKKKELHDLEFEKADFSLGEQSHPVVEELAQPKKAYLTYQPEEKLPNPKLEAFGENDDGWGWGPEEAKLEEEHMTQAESDPQIQKLKSEIALLQEQLRVLQVERENHMEEIRQLQVKSGKLIKKCKALKLKNDQLSTAQQRKTSDSGDFFNLDETIQEELKAQIEQLEKKIKELTNELEKEKLEKSNVLKRVDVITAANERMMEMKEIQDTEVLHWKRKYQEAEDKLRHGEWGSDGFSEGAKRRETENAPSTSTDDRIEELQQTIKELSMDNDELQALLDEQRQLRIDAERSKAIPEATRTEDEYLQLDKRIKELELELSDKAKEIQSISEEKDVIVRNRTHLQELLDSEQVHAEQIRIELEAGKEKNAELQGLLMDKDKLIQDLQQSEKSSKVEQELKQKLYESEAFVTRLESTIIQQEQLVNEKTAAYADLEASFREAGNVQKELKLQIAQLTANLERQRENNSELQLESSDITNNLQQELLEQKQKCEQIEINSSARIREVSEELENTKKAHHQLLSEFDQLSKELDQLTMTCGQLKDENSRKAAELESLRQQLTDSRKELKDDFEVVQQKYQLETQLVEKDTIIAELNGQKVKLEQEIEELRSNLSEKDEELQQVKSEVDARIAKTVAELEENWIAQIDQRGADVAESWKLHLETVESEFSKIQDKLTYEINELEERCNALVNENNELRKNVDAEIRNEVDRISALQQQINDRQHYITELNNKLVEKQNENETVLGKLAQIEDEKEQLKRDLAEKETKLAGMNVIIDTTQKQFEEKREVVEDIVKILERNTSWPLSFEKEELLAEFQRQLNLVTERDDEIRKLNQSINELQSQLNTVHIKDEEIVKYRQLTEDLQRQLSTAVEKDNEVFRLNKLVEESQQQLLVVHEKDGEIFKLNKLVEDLQKDLASVGEKDAEINKLKQVLEELQYQLSLVQGSEGEILRLNQIIENYKVQQDFNQQEISRMADIQSDANRAVEDYKQKLEEYRANHIALQNSLEEKNQLIATLNQQLQLAEGLKNDNNKDIEHLQTEISQTKQDCSTLQESLSECQQQLIAVTSDLADKNQEIENLNQQLAYCQRNFEIQEEELNKTREYMQAKEQEYASIVETMRNTQLRDLENHYEEVIAAKDLDIGSVRTQLQESIQNYQQLSESFQAEASLRHQLEENTKQLEAKVAEQSALIEEENKQLSELRSIIEEQVMKIEELKKELLEKSGDYDSLIAEIDIGRKTITQQPGPSSSNVQGDVGQTSQSERSRHEEEDLSEPVSRAELDLALYMLHQRDVRCEELTVELTHLLEERDTLQLRLSNAMREKEEIRRKLTGTEDLPPSSASNPVPSTPLSKSSAIFLAASGTELGTEPLEASSSSHDLQSKLSELKSVGYKKDKTFVDEQELRRMQQMSIMQQHINEASKLPPEAAAKLVDASYTLSRDVQSPSKVLLNWLWGRSTPKVNDT